MKRYLGIAVTLASLVFIPAACGGDGEGPASAEGASGAASTGPRPEVAAAETTRSRRRGKTVKVANSRFGRILVDGRGHTLYLFTRDRGADRSRCYGSCAAAWPPLYTKGKPRAASGASASRLGTTRRRDGRTQVTYNGHPLYYYVGEDEPGEILCQGVDEFGGLWLVTSPEGKAIR
jgi:predicted lipoprotein with Yx(FWY)xxD motif